ncbi:MULTISPECIES: hypothetical protein [unclassified Pseudomonas]|uniref:hypothetical protein n=1 Tax=unclassified Pseudomonas TaxID=196821 RepID=UPI002580154D|nr:MULTISPECIES: hypothetical protein [unclassified Pseudomonas]
MAMFELEDSDEVNLEKCKTDGETLLKGKKIKNVDVFDCEVKKSVAPSESQSSRTGKIMAKSFSWIMGVVATVIGGLLLAWILASK